MDQFWAEGGHNAWDCLCLCRIGMRLSQGWKVLIGSRHNNHCSISPCRSRVQLDIHKMEIRPPNILFCCNIVSECVVSMTHAISGSLVRLNKIAVGRRVWGRAVQNVTCETAGCGLLNSVAFLPHVR